MARLGDGVLSGGYHHQRQYFAPQINFGKGVRTMANKRLITDPAAQRAIDARHATRQFVEGVDAAIRDGQITDDEHRALGRLADSALRYSEISVTRAERAANAIRTAARVMRGELNTEYLQAETRADGYDPDQLNELMSENETAAL